MKTLLIVLIAAMMPSSCLAQLGFLPPLSIPYIPVTPATPIDGQAAIDRADRQGLIVYENMRLRLSEWYRSEITMVDMLPFRKKQYHAHFMELNKTMGEKAATNALIFNNTSVVMQFAKTADELLFDPAKIQQYKDEYARVQRWEKEVRDKKELDKLYMSVNTNNLFMSNREALVALYSTDETLFLSVTQP